MTLKVELSPRPPQAGDAGVIALAVTEGPLGKQKHFAQLDAELDGALALHAANVEFTGRAYQTVDLPTLGKLTARRVLLVGLGPAQRLDAATLRHVVGAATRAAGNVPTLALSLPEKVRGELLRAVSEGVVLGAYRFTKYLTGERLPRTRLSQVNVHLTGRPTAAEKRALSTGLDVGEAVCIARDAVNEPPNELTPAELARRAQEIAKSGKLKAKVLDKAAIAKAGMHLHYAVGQGSSNEPRFIHLAYTPKGAKKKVVFVGKGLTFDSGGLCIKPAPGMGEMKSDMGGAAAVLGLIAAVSKLRPKVEVHAVVGAAENMPDGAAYRPSDVFGSLDGKTVEVINTDAEGRLVLADALTYARRLEPDLIVDAATLTGACVVALGKSYSAFYTQDDKLARKFANAARKAGESFWRMPLVDEYKEQLKSDIADLKHTGERFGGSITAALFLQEFTGDVPWIHCDVAAPVLYERARGMYPKGGTGHPVLTFLSLVEELG
jgi:leucyl aminopeptidase